MGLPMAGHLLAAGHEVTVASRSRGPIDAAVAQGAVDGGSPLGVAEATEVVILCVPNSPEVSEVVDAMLPALGAGQDRGRLLDHRPRRRAGPARAGGRDGGPLPRRAALGRHGRRAERARSPSWSAVTPPRWPTREPALEPFAGLIVHVGGPGMGQVVKLCNNLIYAAQMAATAEATALAVRSGVDMDKLCEVLTHATGDCVAVRTRLPVPGVIPDSPASNGWQPGFMTDLMAKDLDLALAYAVRARRARGHHGDGPPAAHCGQRAPATGARTSPRWPRSCWRWPAANDGPSAAAHAGPDPGRGPPRPSA